MDDDNSKKVKLSELGFGIDKGNLNSDIIDMLKHSYHKILCINLKTQLHEDIFLKDKEQEESAYAEDIEKWLWDFADKSYVHPEDIEYYKQNTSIGFLRDYFEKYNDPFRIAYRRLQHDEYKWAEMTIVKSKGYTKDNPVVILSVMDTERYFTQSARENQGIFDCFNIASQKNSIEAIGKILEYVASFYAADDAFVCDILGKIVYEYKKSHKEDLEGIFCNRISIDEKLEFVIVNPREMRDNHLLYRCVALIIFRILLDDEIEQKYIIEKQQNRIINALSKRFFCIYRVDLVRGKVYMVYAPDYVKKLLNVSNSIESILETVEKNLVHSDYYERMHEFNDVKKWIERLEDSETISLEFKGTNRWSRAVIIVAERDKNSQASEILYAVQDIEAQKIREAEQDFKLREALRKANEASKAKSTFLSNMSHDIRTPMNAIVGFSRLASQNVDNKEIVKEYLEEITVASKHLVSLINDVLDMSHIESGKMEINPSPCNIVEIFENIRSVMQISAKEKMLSLDLKIGNISHKRVLADELKINQILFNIIGNSIKYNKENGYIRMSCEELPYEKERAGIYRFVIEDNGVGMSKEFLEKIFETFEREQDTVSTGVQGTGLGMSITKGLVDMMGGTIEIESEKNVGTTCTLEIPFEWIENSGHDGKDDEENTEALLNYLRGGRYLLVDDNMVNQKLAEAIFKSIEIDIDIVGSGMDAINALEENDEKYYSAVFMDMQMPVMDGVETTIAIRKHENASIAKIPIIMMTANVFEEDKRKSFDAGVNGYVAKPIDVDDMVKETVRAIKGAE